VLNGAAGLWGKARGSPDAAVRVRHLFLNGMGVRRPAVERLAGRVRGATGRGAASLAFIFRLRAESGGSAGRGLSRFRDDGAEGMLMATGLGWE